MIKYYLLSINTQINCKNIILDGEIFVLKNHVTLGISNLDLEIIKSQKILKQPLFNINDDAVWIEPKLIGTVKYMEKTENGSLRQPIFKGIRND